MLIFVIAMHLSLIFITCDYFFWKIKIDSEFTSLVSNLYYIFIEFIVLLDTVLVIYFARYK